MEQEASVNWTEVEVDTEVRIKGELGKFRFKRVNLKDGSLELWGGVSGRERTRSLPPERVVIPKAKKR